METVNINKSDLTKYYRRKIKKITGKTIPANTQLIRQAPDSNRYFLLYSPGPGTRLDLISGIRICKSE